MKAELGDLDRVTRILKVGGAWSTAIRPSTSRRRWWTARPTCSLPSTATGDATPVPPPALAALPGDTAVICDCVIEVDGG